MVITRKDGLQGNGKAPTTNESPGAGVSSGNAKGESKQYKPIRVSSSGQWMRKWTTVEYSPSASSQVIMSRFSTSEKDIEKEIYEHLKKKSLPSGSKWAIEAPLLATINPKSSEASDLVDLQSMRLFESKKNHGRPTAMPWSGSQASTPRVWLTNIDREDWLQLSFHGPGALGKRDIFGVEITIPLDKGTEFRYHPYYRSHVWGDIQFITR